MSNPPVPTGAPAPRVLFLAPVEPWCRENGSSVIIADLLQGLSTVGGIELLPVFLREPPPGCRARPVAGLPSLQLSLHGVPRWVSMVKAIATGSSPMRLRFRNRQVARQVMRTLREQRFSPTLIHVEHLPLVDIGLALGRTFGCPVVYREHNVEAQLLDRRLGYRGRLARLVLHRMARAEAKAIEASQLTLCISDVDLAWVRAHAPRARAELFPCSLQLERYHEFAGHRRSAHPQIAFAGGLDWAPNETGLHWFVERVLPRVTAALPGSRLAVLARGAAQRAWLRSHPAIHLLDENSDARALFASSSVSIAPLLQGGGVRIKIPESLALGCPVVATTIGAEGHEFPGLTRTDNAADFADACIRHLHQPASAEARRAMFLAVEARHGTTVLAPRLVELWSSLLRTGERPTPAMEFA